MEISITQFKAKCLGIVDRVQREGLRVRITRHGRPAAELVPVENVDGELFGRAAGSTEIRGDVLSTEEKWNAGF